MIVTHTIAEARAARKELGRVAFVPTMGALHAGHVSLMKMARQFAPKVVVSIFVNPTQFGPKEDFNRYPRPIEKDLAMCEEAGVEMVFNPSPEEMYPPYQGSGFGVQGSGNTGGGDAAAPIDVVVDVPSLTTVLEGKHRPGHFRGVCQVVGKLFNVVQPDVACFGQKDYQQVRVLTAMVDALNWPIEMIMCPTVREADGLAMSSRNVYLSPEERQRGLSISRALMKAQEDVKAGVRQANRLVATMQNILLEKHLNIDYVAAVDPKTLRHVDMITGPVVLVIAARVGNTRLIDNVVVEP